MNHFVPSSSPRSEDHSSIDVSSFDALECEVENNDPAGQLIVRVTRNLQKILQWEVDALGLLFEDSLTDEYYRFFIEIISGFRDLSLHIRLLAHKRPNLNILELGAGTGSATRDILRALHFHGPSRELLRESERDFRDCADRMSFFAPRH